MYLVLYDVPLYIDGPAITYEFTDLLIGIINQFPSKLVDVYV